MESQEIVMEVDGRHQQVEIPKSVDDEKIRNIYDTTNFLRNCILSPNYKPSLIYGDAICLSAEGEEVVRKLIPQDASVESSITNELKVAALLSSLRNIDFEKTDVTKLIQAIHEEIKMKRILFPYVFGRELYDKFYSLYNNAKLNYDDTINLLEDTPNGIFQLENLLTGPFGFIKSQEIRYMGPLRSVPIRHCPDTSCHTLHITELSNADSTIIKMVGKIKEIQRGIPIKNPIPKLIHLHQMNQFDDNNLDQLAYLLGTFPEEELRTLLADLIDRNKHMRLLFPQDKLFKKFWQGDGEKIASRLNHAECLQLILLCKDQVIVESLERLIYENRIHIPVTEIRSPHLKRKKKAAFTMNMECSKYGVRCIISGSVDTNTALIRLKNLITKLYTESDEMDKLEWKLRNVNGDNIIERIERYLLSENPKEIIMNLIFDNASYVEKTFQYLKYGDFEFPFPAIKEEFIINKILWKLGFDSMSFPEYLNVFWKRHEQFLRTIKINDVVSENDRETIRSAGVNYFVSVEEVLDYSLSFITWALLSDHYLDTNFVFNLEDARTFMVEKINSKQYSISDSEYLVLDMEGKNTLYPLIKGFTVLAEICEEYLIEKENYKRPMSEYPFYHQKTDIYRFPFEYKIFFLNLRESEAKMMISFLRKITSILEGNNISNVRNRIKHNRPIHEFPNIKELDNTCKAIEQVIKMMDSEGVTPQLYMYSGTEFDQFGRGVMKYKNYRNVPLQLSNNSQYIRCGLPNSKHPQVIIPNLHIKDSIDKPRFYYQDKTLFSNYWNEYPKRKIQYEEECDVGSS